MTKGKLYFICSFTLLLLFTSSVAVTLYKITESPVVVPLGTVSIFAAVIVLAILITCEIKKFFESSFPTIKAVNGEIFKIDKNSVSSKINFKDDLVDISIDHDGVIDLDKISYQIKSIDLGKVDEIINKVKTDDAFKEVVKHDIPSSKFSLNYISMGDLVITYCFTVDDKSIPWGIDVEYNHDEYVGIEFGH